MLCPSLCNDIAFPGGAVLGRGGGEPNSVEIWSVECCVGLILELAAGGGSELKHKPE